MGSAGGRVVLQVAQLEGLDQIAKRGRWGTRDVLVWASSPEIVVIPGRHDVRRNQYAVRDNVNEKCKERCDSGRGAGNTEVKSGQSYLYTVVAMLTLVLRTK